MKQCYYMLILVLFVSCKKENSLLANTKPLSDIFGAKKLKVDTLLIPKFNNKDLLLFYKNNNLETVWESKENRNIVLEKLSKSTFDGLEPNDYDIKNLLELEKKVFLRKKI